MNFLSVENISKRYGERLLFENITFGIDQGQKAALVAKNGSGKTTLLRLLMGVEKPDTGNIVFNNSIHVGYLSQEDHLNAGKTIKEEIFEGENEGFVALEAYNQALNEGDPERINQAYQKVQTLGAWDLEVKVEQILTQLELKDQEQRIEKLSGGQKKRLALAKVLIHEPDLLILDEPTNHLDLDMIEWLEGYLGQSQMTLLIVTHDRYFLEVICDIIFELTPQEMHRYPGNFSYYLEKKAEREAHEAATVSKAKNLMRKELEWMRRQPKARGTKQKARKDAFVELKGKATPQKKDASLEMQIRMERLGTKIIEFHNVKKSFGALRILDEFEYTFKRKECIGIVGKNGVGKTTFIEMLLGNEDVDGGKIVRGETVKFGYFAQKGMAFSDDQRVIEVVKEVAEYIPLVGGTKITAAQLLERFLFPRSMHYNLVRKLSGGEKKRLQLLRVLMENPNFLILDEPTNDLDIFTLSVLEDFLQSFQGVMVVVSHDRYFMDKLVDHLFVFRGEGKVKDFPGNYTQWRESELQQQKNKAPKSSEKQVEDSQKSAAQEKRKLSYNEQREFDQLSKDIEELEARKKELTEQLQNETSNDEMIAVGNHLNAVVNALEEKEMRWLELAEFA